MDLRLKFIDLLSSRVNDLLKLSERYRPIVLTDTIDYRIFTQSS